jgi:hypothetical protein
MVSGPQQRDRVEKRWQSRTVFDLASAKVKIDDSFKRIREERDDIVHF